MMLFEQKNIEPKLKDRFFQSKFDHYRGVTTTMILLTTILNIGYYFMDLYLSNNIPVLSLCLRLVILIPFGVYLLQNQREQSWKKNLPTIYAVIYTSILTSIISNFMAGGTETPIAIFIMFQFAFVGVGMGVPLKWNFVCQGCSFIFMLVLSLLCHLQRPWLVLAFGIPIFIGTIVTLKKVEDAYVELYLMKKDLWHKTMTDTLTQLHNRNKIRDLVVLGTKKLKWKEQTIFLMLDIDHFKRINDTYGHDAGDKILQFVAKIILTCTRTSDVVIRWGGEEFVIILPNASHDVGIMVAERIRKKIETTNNGIENITVSIGLTEYDGIDYEQTIENADKAMYYAKEHGRNRTVSCELTNTFKTTMP